MPNASHKLIDKLSGSRNFNTSEWTSSNLKGDSFDYILHGTARDGIIGIKFNADATASNRLYNMQGSGSIASASINDATTLTSVVGSTTSGKPSAFRLIITGNSSIERYINSFVSLNSAINVRAIYWKDTVSELTSLTLFDAVSRTSVVDLYLEQIPKQSNLENYDLMDKLSWSAESATKSFTGLDGDSDGEYLIKWESDGIADVRINNDSGSVYTRERLTNSNGTLTANNATTTTITDSLYYDSYVLIDSISGRERLVSSRTAKTTASQQSENITWYTNTVNNLTELNIIPSGSITATAFLYKRKSNKTIDESVMVTVAEIPISGDFSAGVTISGIEGDRIDGEIKVEFIGIINSSILVQFNNDTASNYPLQNLVANAGTRTALATTQTSVTLASSGTANTCNGIMHLYPKSGQNRVCFVERARSKNIFAKVVHWWNNSISELNQIDIYSNNTNSVDGFIKISIPKNTKQATGAFTVTIN